MVFKKKETKEIVKDFIKENVAIFPGIKENVKKDISAGDEAYKHSEHTVIIKGK